MKIKKYKLTLVAHDLVILIIPLLLSLIIRYYELEKTGRWYINLYYRPSLFIPYIIVIISMIIIFRNSGLYKLHRLFDSYYQFVIFVKSVTISYSILITILFILKHPLLEQRKIIIYSCLLVFAMLLLFRIFFMKKVLRYLLKNRILGERVIIVGAGEAGSNIAKELLGNQYAYFVPVGFLDDGKKPGMNICGLKVLDKISNIDKYSDIFDDILIALTNISYNKLKKIIEICNKVGKDIHVISELYRIVPEKVEVEKFDGFRTFQVPSVKGINKLPYMVFKRVIDYSGALLLIVLLLPIWIIIAILIKMDSDGPVFYKAPGIGYKEKPFKWYKFRTMYTDTDDSIHRKIIKEMAEGKKTDGKKIENDPRITKIGAFLRKYSIDEFPQLINVLKGEMSLVGPRPVLPYEFEAMQEWQKEILSVLPGMTGLWQIRGRNEVNFVDQYVLDLYYVKNRTAWLDMEILFNTIPVVLSGKSGV